MPFTFAHPAVVLPLTKRDGHGLSLTGLIAGAMVPDFEYFIRMHIGSIYSHTILGLFWFDVPLAVLIAFIFHNLIRNAFYDNPPSVLSTRLSTYKLFNWNAYFKKHWPVVLLSVFVGACSHLLLDDFTHMRGYFVKQAPGFFTQTIIGSIPLFKILQHSFTLLSTLYIIYYIYHMPETGIKPKPSLKYWAWISVFTITILIVRFLIMPDYRDIANVIVSGITAFLLGLMLVPLFLYRNKPNQDPG
ncbi:DUF4184 family protein [Mucilaginibacter sp. CAU 1740]|uniref:DUF4184 family protein n=1 Tax=Mucilaginibacter sp. CAU 1740 TaxID=3140365 RepID=UPI00325AAEE5